MFAPSRDQARRFFFDTWKKYRNGEALSALERIALTVIGLHPEYHALFECLAETIRQAQRAGGPPDEALYPACLRAKSGK